MGVNDDLFDRLLARSTTLDRFREGEIRKLVRLLNNSLYPDILESAERHLSRIRLRGPTSGFWKTKRYNALLEDLSEISSEAFRQFRDVLGQDLDKLAFAEVNFQRRAIEASLPFDFTTTRPSGQLLRSIVRSRPFQGRLLRGWASNLDQATRAAVRQQLDLGLIQGESIPQMVRRLRGTRANGFRGPLTTSRHNTEAIVRTSVTHTISNSRSELYKVNTDIISGEVYRADLDTGTTDICISLDGKEFKIGEGEHPPMHHQCRSERFPILKSFEELGIPGLGKLPESTRASIDGQVPASTTYAQWLRGQSVARQNEVLGVQRGQWFRQGRLNLRNLTDNRNRPLTLRELEEHLSTA